MKILAADYTRYVPRERLVERVRYGTGFVSGKTKEGAFYLTENKGGDGILSILDTIVPIVGTVANAVAKGANFYKEIRGGGIEPEALAEVLRAEGGERSEEDALPSDTAKDALVATKAAVGVKSAPAATSASPAQESLTASASETKTGKGFFYISPR